MILPIYAYGQNVLKKNANDVESTHPKLTEFIADMWETMYNAKGIGLAAPQVGKSFRIFIIDTVQIEDEEKDVVGVKKVFINAQMLEESGEENSFEEGCLSIPEIRGEVIRKSNIKIQYLDESFNEHIEEYNGMTARVIQHEYDHIEGKLFLDYLTPLKKRLIKRKLESIKKGKMRVEYRMRFAK